VDVAVKLPGSAPGKLLSSKFKVQTSKAVEGEIGENLGVEEAIPAATYIPRDDDLIDDSDSSTDFEGEVNKVMDGKHSQSINRVWMSQHEQPCVKTQGVFIPELDKKCACCYPWKAKLRGRHGFH